MAQSNETVLDLHDEKIKKYTKCVEHRDEPLTLFCVQCDCLICYSCILGTHNTHTLSKISDVAERKHQELCNLLDKYKTQTHSKESKEERVELNKKADYSHQNKSTESEQISSRKVDRPEQINDITTHNDEQCGVIEHSERDESVRGMVYQLLKCLQTLKEANQAQDLVLENIFTEINNRTISLIRGLEKRKESLMTEARHMRSQQQLALAAQGEDLEFCLSYLYKHQKGVGLTSPLDQTIQIQVLRILHSFPMRIKDFEKFRDDLGFCTYDNDDNSSVDGISTNALGRLRSTWSTDVDAESGSESIDGARNDQQNEKRRHDMANKHFRLRSGRIDKISPIDDRTAFIVQNGNLIKLDIKQQQQRQYQIMSGVVDITRLTENGIYICQRDQKAIRRYTLEGKTFPFTHIKSTPDCIHFSNTKYLFVFIASPNPQCIQFNTDGTATLQTIEWNQSWCPSRFFIVDDNFAALCKRSEMPKVSGLIVSKNPTKRDKGLVRYRGVVGHPPEDFFDPRDLCYDGNQHILVTDYQNCAVHLTDTNGKFEKFLMMAEDGLSLPISVTLDRFGYVWIGCEDGTIHIVKYNPVV